MGLMNFGKQKKKSGKKGKPAIVFITADRYPFHIRFSI